VIFGVKYSNFLSEQKKYLKVDHSSEDLDKFGELLEKIKKAN
jgi:hypothetical protein